MTCPYCLMLARSGRRPEDGPHVYRQQWHGLAKAEAA